MGWQRAIPFGYKMEEAEIKADKDEANMVKRIFAMYLSGYTLSRIAAEVEMTGIRYHVTSAAWNKNMVKRILDNSRYIGNADYPQIIDAKDYEAVKLIIEKKQSRRKPCGESIRPVSKIISCAICGKAMHRHTNSRGVYWACANSSCREVVKISDDSLREHIDQCLTKLVLSPSLLEPGVTNEQRPITTVLRLQNELTAAFNRGTETPEYIRSLIFALASERYRAMPDMSLIHTLKELQTRIAAEGITDENRREIEQTVIRRVLLGRESGVSIELINGKIISAKEEVEK